MLIGLTGFLQGGAYLAEGGDLSVGKFALGALLIICGGAAALGFLTPIAVAAIGLTAIGNACSLIPPPAANLFHAALPAILVAGNSIAIIFLGPGALSIDARRFGRREIIIPHSSSSSRA